MIFFEHFLSNRIYTVYFFCIPIIFLFLIDKVQLTALVRCAAQSGPERKEKMTPYNGIRMQYYAIMTFCFDILNELVKDLM